MRLLALVLLLLPSVVGAAVWCDPDQIVAAEAGQCPGVNTNLQAQPTHECVLITYNSTSASGTSYAYVVPGLNQPPPGCASNTTVLERKMCTGDVRDEWIVAGTGASATGTQAAVEGERSMQICGLAAEQPYTLTLLDKDGPNLQGLHGEPLTVSFTTEATPGTPPSDFSPKWYAGTGGNDLADCLTRGTRCATPSPIVAAMSPGDDVALEPGSVWNDYRLVPTVGGTSSDRSVWCTSYESGGQDYCWSEGPSAGSTVRAEFNGTYEIRAGGCANDGNATDCEYSLSGNNPNAVPQNQFQGLVHLTSLSWVTFDGVAIRDSAGDGIYVDESYSVASRFIGKNLLIDGTMKRSVHVGRAVAGGRSFWTDITMTESSRQIPDGVGGIWSSCVSFDSNNSALNSGIVMQNSTLDNCGGEGYATLRIGYVTFRNVTGSRFRRPGFYPDASQHVVGERVSLDMRTYGGGAGTAEAVGVGVECYGSSTQDAIGNVVRDSHFYNIGSTQTAMRFFIEGNDGCPEPFKSQGYDPRSLGFQLGLKAYGNTFDMVAGANITSCTGCTVNNNVDEIVAKNNIFTGSVNGSLPTVAGVDWDYNAFDSTPGDADLTGANDVYGGIGLAAGASNPALSAGSSALNQGVLLNAPLLDIANYAEFSNFSDGCILTEAQWEQQSYADINCTPRANPPNIGAWEGNP